MNHLAADLTVAGFSVTRVSANATTDLSAYHAANMIVVGSAGAEAASMASALSGTNRNRVKTVTNGEGFVTYIVGTNQTATAGNETYELNDNATVNAIQRFYSQIVVNGEFVKPVTSDTTLVSTGSNRDPGILYHNGVYYYCENQSGNFRYGMYTSTDRLNWTQTTPAFDPKTNTVNTSYFNGCTTQAELDAANAIRAARGEGAVGNAQYWAPEIHAYNGAFYLFGTYLDKDTGYRGTAIFKSDTPDGPYIPWSNGFVTPNGRHSIDGTLYVDANGTPYMVYVDEWPNYGSTLSHATNTAKGRMAWVQLSADLSTTVGTHHTDMFKSSDPAWTDYGVTDGPWLYTCEDGTLLMIWSNYDANHNYAIGLAKSSNGRLDGTWTQVGTEALFAQTGDNIYCVQDGGHACIIEADGRLYLVLHSTNSGRSQYVTWIPLVERNGSLYLDLIH